MDNIQTLKSQMKATKVDDFSIEVVKQPITPEPTTQTYDRGFLENQLVIIQQQADDYAAARQADLDEVNTLLALCDEQKIIVKPLETINPKEQIKQ